MLVQYLQVLHECNAVCSHVVAYSLFKWKNGWNYTLIINSPFLSQLNFTLKTILFLHKPYFMWNVNIRRELRSSLLVKCPVAIYNHYTLTIWWDLHIIVWHPLLGLCSTYVLTTWTQSSGGYNWTDNCSREGTTMMMTKRIKNKSVEGRPYYNTHTLSLSCLQLIPREWMGVSKACLVRKGK